MVLCAGVKYQKINDSKDKKVRISDIYKKGLSGTKQETQIPSKSKEKNLLT